MPPPSIAKAGPPLAWRPSWCASGRRRGKLTDHGRDHYGRNLYDLVKVLALARARRPPATRDRV
jgi:hypothetical protein